MNEPSGFTAAVVQASPVYMDLDGTVHKTIALIEEAASAGARLIVFPEVWLPGYPYWAWMDSPAWGLQWAARYAANSLELDSRQERRIAAAAADHDIHVVLGCSERSGATLYMSQITYDNRGRRLAARRKLKPTHAERMVFGEGDGSDLVVSQTELGRLGALSCWEHLQPLTRYAMFGQDEQIHAGSWPAFCMYANANQLSAAFNDAVSQVYAGEGGCYVLAATAVMTEPTIDQLCQSPHHRQLIRPGGGRSMAFGPDGSRLADYLADDEEGLVFARIELDGIAVAKAVLDPVGHSARPDVAQLLLDRRPRRPVEPMATDRTTEDDERLFPLDDAPAAAPIPPVLSLAPAPAPADDPNAATPTSPA